MRLFILTLIALAFAPHAFAADFVPLTSIPGVGDVTGTPDLPAFLNSLYRICIGAAAVLAVLQIVRGGMTYMLGDSITEKRQARQHIVMAVLGLVLVLSPALVFGIINPDILDLRLDVGQLAPGALPTVPEGGFADAESCRVRITDGAVISPIQENCCRFQGFTVVPGRTRSDGTRSDSTCVQNAQQTEREGTITLTPGVYFLMVAQAEPAEGAPCAQAQYGTFDTAEQCSAGAQQQSTRAGWNIVTECYRATEATKEVSVPSSICPDIQPLAP